jgi:copper(I)-binding protein
MMSARFVVLFGMYFLSGGATALEYSSHGVTILHPWARTNGATVGGTFLEMKATRGSADRLIGARTPAAASVELHNHVMEGGIAKMRRVDAVALPAGKSIVLKQTQVPILSPLPASVRHTWTNAI